MRGIYLDMIRKADKIRRRNDVDPDIKEFCGLVAEAFKYLEQDVSHAESTARRVGRFY